MKINIRMASESDAEALLRIYAPYVLKTAVTFENEVPQTEDFRARMRDILGRYPYLVAETENDIVGYAHAKPFDKREAYSRSAEAVIYIREDMRGIGLGKALYENLFEYLKRQNVINLYACISYTEKEDEYLSQASPAFHAALGFHKAAHFTKCGYKFGRWYDVIWMEKFLSAHEDLPKEFLPVKEI